jgi:hypothetical protein
MNKPSETHALHPTLNKKVENHHSRPRPVFQNSRMSATFALSVRL